MGTIRANLKMLASRHVEGQEPNVFIVSLPRSGSTWLMELVLTQPGFGRVSEPFNLRRPVVREHLGVHYWTDLHAIHNKNRIRNYLRKFCDGTMRDARFGNAVSPLKEFYRPITHRKVFKIIHGAEEHVGWLTREFNGKGIMLLRHPLAVSVSRRQYPKLEALLESDFKRYIGKDQLSLASRILGGHNKLLRGVLEWCLRTSVLLNLRTDDWILLTYEQLVLDPEPVVNLMCGELLLPRKDRMLHRLNVPSSSTSQSAPDTRHELRKADGERDKNWIVGKWRESVSAIDLEATSDLLASFRLDDVYQADGLLPRRKVWICAGDAHRGQGRSQVLRDLSAN